MKKMKGSDRSWDFIRKCSKEQIQLLKETLNLNCEEKQQHSPVGSKLSQKSTRKVEIEGIIRVLSFSENGKVISYGAFLRGIIESLCDEKMPVLSDVIDSL